MRAIVQRVSAATVRVEGREVGRCGYGLLLLVGVHRLDTLAEAIALADRIVKLRIFNDAEGKLNLALTDFPLDAPGAIGFQFDYGVLAVSNFTVYGDATKGRRPSYMDAASGETAKELFERFVQALRGHGFDVQTGVFGAHMEVSSINDGPVTVIVECAPKVSV